MHKIVGRDFDWDCAEAVDSSGKSIVGGRMETQNFFNVSFAFLLHL